jgi:CheY-like chemotaxis protein
VYAASAQELREIMRDSIEAVIVDIERAGAEATALRDLVLEKYTNVLLCSVSNPGMAGDFPRALTKPVLPLQMRQFLDDLRYHRPPVAPPPVTIPGDGVTGKKVLVVEDHKVNQHVIAKILSSLKVEFAIAENGLEALQKLEEDTFDMVFMDCQMPVMDGLEAARRIRQSNAPYQEIPIVALTASAIEGDEEQCREAGMNGYLAKPVRLAQIADAVKTFTQRDE